MSAWLAQDGQETPVEGPHESAQITFRVVEEGPPFSLPPFSHSLSLTHSHSNSQQDPSQDGDTHDVHRTERGEDHEIAFHDQEREREDERVEASDNFRLILVVFACNRFQSFHRLWTSLRRARYDGMRVDVHVMLDYPATSAGTPPLSDEELTNAHEERGEGEKREETLNGRERERESTEEHDRVLSFLGGRSRTRAALPSVWSQGRISVYARSQNAGLTANVIEAWIPANPAERGGGRRGEGGERRVRAHLVVGDFCLSFLLTYLLTHSLIYLLGCLPSLFSL